MLKEFRYPIKVSSKITPVARKQRVSPELKIGETYYVSFGSGWAYPCQVSEIINEFSKTEVKIQIRLKDKHAYVRKNGIMEYQAFQEHLVYVNEIGKTPEDAVKNSV